VNKWNDRAYGDRALFERFRWRFIIAPIFLLAVCVGFYFWDIKTNPVVMIVFLWGVWHGMMQTYGFGRIYRCKTGSFAALTRRLDFATCGSGSRRSDSFTGQDDRYPGGVLRMRSAIYFAGRNSRSAAKLCSLRQWRYRFFGWRITGECGSREPDRIR